MTRPIAQQVTQMLKGIPLSQSLFVRMTIPAEAHLVMAILSSDAIIKIFSIYSPLLIVCCGLPLKYYFSTMKPF